MVEGEKDHHVAFKEATVLQADTAANLIDEQEAGAGESGGELADGLMSILQPTIEKLDERIDATRSSQTELRTQIETLAAALQKVSEEYSAPYDLETYIKSLQESKRRVAVVGSILQNAQERLMKLHQNVARETARRTALLEQPVNPPPT